MVSGGQIRQGFVNQTKEYGLYPHTNLEPQKDFKLECSIIRFAYQKMCRKKGGTDPGIRRPGRS